MTPGPKRSDSIAEWAIVALVVVVLGVAATQTKLEPAAPSTLTVDEIAARVHMQMPIARECLRGSDNPAAACGARVAANGRP
jgi:hypothetical protein